MSAVRSISLDNFFSRLIGAFERRVKFWAVINCFAWDRLVSDRSPRRFRGARCSAVAISLLIFSVGLVAPVRADCTVIDLSHQQPGTPPQHFQFWRSGQLDLGHWAVIREAATDGGAVIQRVDERKTQSALAIYTPFSSINASARMQFKLVEGSAPSAGVVLRVASPEDYYLVRASADEQRVSLLHVVHGVSEEIAGVDAEIAQHHWQSLEVTAKDTSFAIWLDGQLVLTAFDRSKLAGGQFGIWTERDGVTQFSQIEISPTTSAYQRCDWQGRSGG
jgi:hypothetical protein